MPFIKEDMKHFQLEPVFVALDLIYIKLQDIFRPGSLTVRYKTE